jgi:addiction module HigA family antidote
LKPAINLGKILLEHYLIPIGISQNALARALDISPQSINDIVLGSSNITPEMSFKLGNFFQTKAPSFGSTSKPPAISAGCGKKSPMLANLPIGSSPQPWIPFSYSLA